METENVEDVVEQLEAGLEAERKNPNWDQRYKHRKAEELLDEIQDQLRFLQQQFGNRKE